MANRFLDAIRRRFGGDARYPPPTVAGPDDAAKLKDALVRFHAAAGPRFRQLFLHGRPTAAMPDEGADFALFERAGLVRGILAGAFRPCVRVFPLQGAMIATDLLSQDDADQVFSLMFEQVLLVRNLGVRPGDRVLELCLGSGVNSLFAARTAASVTGVDVNPRALDFARFNAAVNPGAVPIECVQGSLFAPLPPDARYDVILINPPFEPVPPGADHFLHSHGGEDGLDVVRACLAEAPARLRPGGRFVMFTWSPGDATSVRVADLAQRAFPAHRIDVLLADEMPLDDRIATFRDAPGYDAWRGRLRAAGITRIWGVLLTAVPDAAPGIRLFERADEVDACREAVASWE